MKRSATALTIVGLTFALAACNPADKDRTTSVPNGTDRMAAVTSSEPTGLSAPPVQPDRNPPAPNANDAAPGTDASLVYDGKPTLKDSSDAKISGDSVEAQRLAIEAQDAAVRAPDTASADAAKKEVMDRATPKTPGDSETARDTAANNPRRGALTKEEEANELPKAGQVNNHSSTALEKDSGRPSN